MVKYIVKGLSGFYEAGFSDKYFYNQDLTYTDTEFRDMWEYKLNLTPYQQKAWMCFLTSFDTSLCFEMTKRSEESQIFIRSVFSFGMTNPAIANL